MTMRNISTSNDGSFDGLYANARLVRFTSEDGLDINAVLAYRGLPDTIVHVHGKCGNFYQNQFIDHMLDLFPAHGFNFIAFNHRGHDALAEGYRNGQLEYIGGSVERFAESKRDIHAAIEYAGEFSKRVFLQGHSNGCEKVLHYVSDKSQQTVAGLILLSPSDSREMQRIYIHPETIDEQIARLSLIPKSIRTRFWVNPSEYGIHVGEKNYHIPCTAASLLDMLSGPALKIFSQGSHLKPRRITHPVLACLGTNDPYLGKGVASIITKLKALTSRLSVVEVPGVDHHFCGHECLLVEEVARWAKRYA